MTRRNGDDLLVVTSAGGVLLDMLALARSYPGERRFVASDAIDTRTELACEATVFRPEPVVRHPSSLLREAVSAWRSLRSDRPRVLISAGTALAVPWFVSAMLLGVPRVWVETFNIVDRQGLAARVCARCATLVAVQHPERVATHLRTVLVGELV